MCDTKSCYVTVCDITLISNPKFKNKIKNIKSTVFDSNTIEL